MTRRRALQAAGIGLLVAGSASGADLPLAPPDKQPKNVKVPDAAKKKAGWAVVGLGQLAIEEIFPAFAQCERANLTALVSGHPEKAQRVAAHYGVDPKRVFTYDNFDDIASDKEIDVVYIVLPNSLHAPYTIRALKAGKHVLCEKPMAANSAECEAMIKAASDAERKLMIAYRLRYEPFNISAIEMLRKKELGDIKLIEAVNSQNVAAPNIRLSKELAGGPVGDVGIYCINACRYLTGEEPTEVSAMAFSSDDPRFREVPETVTFQMRFPSGVLAHCGCGFNTAESRRYRVHCTKGWLELDPAFSYRGLKLQISKGNDRTQVQLPDMNHFASEMDHFSECVLDGKEVRTPGEEGLRDMRIIERIHEAAREGKTLKI